MINILDGDAGGYSVLRSGWMDGWMDGWVGGISG